MTILKEKRDKNDHNKFPPCFTKSRIVSYMRNRNIIDFSSRMVMSIL